MLSSFAISLAFLVAARNGVAFSTHVALLLTIAFTTVCWVVTAFVGPETDRKTLIEFYRKVRPFGPGWNHIREEAGLSGERSTDVRDNIPLALVGWVAGCAMIWSSLFTVGNYLYGRTGYALGLLLVFLLSGATLLAVVRRLWSGGAKGEAQ
jgi:hypothetical protein